MIRVQLAIHYNNNSQVLSCETAIQPLHYVVIYLDFWKIEKESGEHSCLEQVSFLATDHLNKYLQKVVPAAC